MSHTIDTWAYGPTEAPTISEALAENRVVRVKLKDGLFEVREECDQYYGAILTADQLIEWGRELIAMGEQAKGAA